jgi:hypothetical protein
VSGEYPGKVCDIGFESPFYIYLVHCQLRFRNNDFTWRRKRLASETWSFFLVFLWKWNSSCKWCWSYLYTTFAKNLYVKIGFYKLATCIIWAALNGIEDGQHRRVLLYVCTGWVIVWIGEERMTLLLIPQSLSLGRHFVSFCSNWTVLSEKDKVLLSWNKVVTAGWDALLPTDRRGGL